MPYRSDSTQRKSQPPPLPSPSFSHPVTHGKEDTFEQGKLVTSIKQASQTSSRNITLSLFPSCFPLRKKKNQLLSLLHTWGAVWQLQRTLKGTPKSSEFISPPEKWQFQKGQVSAGSRTGYSSVRARLPPGTLEESPVVVSSSCCCVDCSIQNWAQDLVVLGSTLWLNCVPGLKPCFWRQVLASIW